MEFTVSLKKVADLQSQQIESYPFPKYTTQIINLANGNAQGTRPSVVGQLSEMFPEFERECDSTISVDKWADWYNRRYPNAVQTATDKVYDQILNLQAAMGKITKDMVKEWVKDLIYNKTFTGLYLQGGILAVIAEKSRTSYRLATKAEEARGIDGYVGGKAYSIKPMTYKTMRRLSEIIDPTATMVYYEKRDKNLFIEIDG